MGMVNQYELSVLEDVDGLIHVTGKFSDGNPIDLGFPEHWRGTTADEEDIDKAMAGIDRLWMDRELGTSGRRNDDAVNMCICLHVLGCADIGAWFDDMFDRHSISVYDYGEFMEHVKRVECYLDAWGPAHDMGRALYFTID